MILELILFLRYIQGITALGDCAWTVNGFDFDISSLEGQTLQYNDSSTQFVYSYTPCKNGLDCGSAKNSPGCVRLGTR